MQICGHEVEFVDCREIGQGGPEACGLLIDNRELKGKKFDPSPLPCGSGIVLPVRKWNFFSGWGYALCFIDLDSLRITTISKKFPYIRLVGISEDHAEIKTRVYDDEQTTTKIGLKFR